MRFFSHIVQAMLDDRDLIQVIEARRYGGQHELVDALHARGISVTQSTLSRHLARLGYRKVQGRYQRDGAVMVHATAILPAPPNLLLLKTDPGYANALAAELDRDPLPGQIGCVAGDDTVLVALAVERYAEALDTAHRLLR